MNLSVFYLSHNCTRTLAISINFKFLLLYLTNKKKQIFETYIFFLILIFNI